MTNHIRIVSYFFGVNRLSKRPTVFVINQIIDHFVALFFKTTLIGHCTGNITTFSPSGFCNTGYFGENIFFFLFFFSKIKTLIFYQIHQMRYDSHHDYSISLCSDILIQSLMSNTLLYNTLHHSASIVVLNIAFPSCFRHKPRWSGLLLKTLLSKILNRIIISISQEIVNIVFCCMIF